MGIDRNDTETVARARRARVGAWLLASIVTAATIGAIVQLHGGDDIAPASNPSRVTILPFDVRADGERGYLGEAMATLLAAGMDSALDLRTVDSHAVLLRMREAGGTAVGDAAAASIRPTSTAWPSRADGIVGRGPRDERRYTRAR